VVLVHGGVVDGARWDGVFDLLVRCGSSVSVVPKPTSSLTVGPAATKQILEQQEGNVVLVAHSYSVAITEAGNHPKVKRLVYITAFAAGAGESVSSLIANPPPSAPILPSQNGFLFFDQAKFVASFAADVESAKAAFMAKSQVPWGVDALQGTVTTRSICPNPRRWRTSSKRLPLCDG
jgi:pimeloyl-ACP methyl ester carboxylesterase